MQSIKFNQALKRAFRNNQNSEKLYTALLNIWLNNNLTMEQCVLLENIKKAEQNGELSSIEKFLQK